MVDLNMTWIEFEVFARGKCSHMSMCLYVFMNVSTRIYSYAWPAPVCRNESETRSGNTSIHMNILKHMYINIFAYKCKCDMWELHTYTHMHTRARTIL